MHVDTTAACSPSSSPRLHLPVSAYDSRPLGPLLLHLLFLEYGTNAGLRCILIIMSPAPVPCQLLKPETPLALAHHESLTIPGQPMTRPGSTSLILITRTDMIRSRALAPPSPIYIAQTTEVHRFRSRSRSTNRCFTMTLDNSNCSYNKLARHALEHRHEAPRSCRSSIDIDDYRRI